MRAAGLALLLAACGGIAVIDPSDGGPDGGAGVTSSSGSSKLASTTSKQNSTDAGSGAGGCGVSPGGFFNCCDGVSCRGFCTSAGCACGLIEGGCSEPTVCCNSGLCTAADKCAQ